MKRLLLVFLLLCPLVAQAQQQPSFVTGPCMGACATFASVPGLIASGTRQTINVGGRGILFHQVAWVSNGTPTTISVVVSATTDGTTFSTLTTSTSAASSYTFSGAYRAIGLTVTVTGTADVDATYNGIPVASAKLAAPLTAGSVPFADSSGNLTQDNANFFYNGTSHLLGVGIAPETGFRLKVEDVSGSYALKISDGATKFIRIGAGDPEISASGAALDIRTVTAHAINFRTNDAVRASIGATTGHFTPNVDNSQALGGLATRWSDTYTVGLHSGASAMTFATSGGDVVALTLSTGTGTGNLATFAGTATASAYQTNTVAHIVNVGASGFTTAADTSLQTITGLSWTFPANLAVSLPFNCTLAYSQATATAAVSFGIGAATVAPTNLQAMGEIYTNTTVVTEGNVVITSATSSAIVTATPSAITTIWNAHLSGFIENPSNGSSNTYNVSVKTATAADAVTVKRGSFCTIGKLDEFYWTERRFRTELQTTES